MCSKVFGFLSGSLCVDNILEKGNSNVMNFSSILSVRKDGDNKHCSRNTISILPNLSRKMISSFSLFLGILGTAGTITSGCISNKCSYN